MFLIVYCLIFSFTFASDYIATRHREDDVNVYKIQNNQILLSFKL